MAHLLPIAQVSEDPTLRIGDIAKLTDKSQRAVRLYEEMGLLGAVYRSEGGHRLYGRDAVVRIGWIDKLRALGFSLTQIQGLLGEWSDSNFAPDAMARVRRVFEDKLRETKHQIRMLETLAGELHESLSYLSTCEVCDPNTLLGSCAGCECSHEPKAAPALVAGFHGGGKQ